MAICSSCGGSGIQRISQQQSRTCQTCLGRGVTAAVELAPQTLDLARVTGLRAGVSTQEAPATPNAVASSSAAR
ncbi:putative DnaJ type IV chaperone protein [Synechococcus sp. A15-60]|nr:putative DnaJ type IV chaperone protein [Synechococcus sp. A15-60]